MRSPREALHSSCFASMHQLLWSVTLPVPIMWLLNVKQKSRVTSCPFSFPRYFILLCYPLPQLRKTSKCFPWAMGDVLNSSLRNREGPWEPIPKDNEISPPILIPSDTSFGVSRCMGGRLGEDPIQSKCCVPKILLRTYC